VVESLRVPGAEYEVTIEELIRELVEVNRGVRRMNATLCGHRAEILARIGAPEGRRVVLEDGVEEISFRLVVKVVEV